MTIKKRLFVSNILMIVISILLAGIIASICVFTFNSLIKADANSDIKYYKEMQPIRTEIVDLATTYFNNPTDNLSLIIDLNNLLVNNNMRLEICSDKKTIAVFGDKIYRYKYNYYSRSNDSTILKEDLYTEKVNIKNTEYEINIYNIRLIDKNQQKTRMQIVLFISILVSLVVAVMLTNKLMTKFVFAKIEEPLEVLSKGVRQISEGNLSYQIEYNNPDEFAEVCDDFNKMAVRLKESIEKTQLEEESRKELLASISHDLRSPLTSIKAYIEGLIDGVASTPEMQKAYMNTIKTKTEDIDKLVSRLFLFSKLNIGQQSVKNEIFNLNDEINDVINSVKYDYSNHGVELQSSLAEEAVIMADRSYIHSIISNIFDNSVKYKPEDRDIVIDIRTELDGDFVKMTVSDSGDGVPNDALPKLFDVFYRVDSSRTNPKKGSGLGLAITAKSVQNMGGSIYAENGKLGGLSIIIKLPLYKGDNKNGQQSINN